MVWYISVNKYYIYLLYIDITIIIIIILLFSGLIDNYKL